MMGSAADDYIKSLLAPRPPHRLKVTAPLKGYSHHYPKTPARAFVPPVPFSVPNVTWGDLIQCAPELETVLGPDGEDVCVDPDMVDCQVFRQVMTMTGRDMALHGPAGCVDVAERLVHQMTRDLASNLMQSIIHGVAGSSRIGPPIRGYMSGRYMSGLVERGWTLESLLNDKVGVLASSTMAEPLVVSVVPPGRDWVEISITLEMAWFMPRKPGT